MPAIPVHDPNPPGDAAKTLLPHTGQVSAERREKNPPSGVVARLIAVVRGKKTQTLHSSRLAAITKPRPKPRS